MNSMISRAVAPEKQGVVQGSNTALTSLVSIIAPIAGGILYTQLGHATPYILVAGVMVLATIVVWMFVPKLKAPSASELEHAG